MKLTLDVKEHKAAFLLELLDTFKDFVAVELPAESLSAEEKAFIDRRLAAYEAEPNRLVSWAQLAESVKNLTDR